VKVLFAGWRQDAKPSRIDDHEGRQWVVEQVVGYWTYPNSGAGKIPSATCSPSPLALHAKGVPVPDIARKLTVTSGKNAGKRPSVASQYRALADVIDGDRAAALRHRLRGI
jgi:hypothetical protein